MGRLNIEQKNLDALLEAFAELRDAGMDVELNFYGDGNDRSVLDAIARNLDVRDRVSFHGRYDHRTDLRGIMAANHVFTYTSNYEGGPCFTLLELLQAGRYVVAAPVGGIPDIYDGHSEAGQLVDPDNPSVIADALASAIESIREGEANPHQVRSRYAGTFDLKTAHEQWVDALGLQHVGATSGKYAVAD
jgi:glycosyltransferase involved in cell wall biosynthesis